MQRKILDNPGNSNVLTFNTKTFHFTPDFSHNSSKEEERLNVKSQNIKNIDKRQKEKSANVKNKRENNKYKDSRINNKSSEHLRKKIKNQVHIKKKMNYPNSKQTPLDNRKIKILVFNAKNRKYEEKIHKGFNRMNNTTIDLEHSNSRKKNRYNEAENPMFKNRKKSKNSLSKKSKSKRLMFGSSNNSSPENKTSSYFPSIKRKNSVFQTSKKSINMSKTIDVVEDKNETGYKIPKFSFSGIKN